MWDFLEEISAKNPDLETWPLPQFLRARLQEFSGIPLGGARKREPRY